MNAEQARLGEARTKKAPWKASPEDMLIQITVDNRGPEPATLQLLPTLWFRNDWAWGGEVARQPCGCWLRINPAGSSRSRIETSGSASFTRKARRRSYSRRMKPIRSGWSARPILPLTSKTASATSPFTAKKTRSIPRRGGQKSQPITRLRWGRENPARFACDSATELPP